MANWYNQITFFTKKEYLHIISIQKISEKLFKTNLIPDPSEIQIQGSQYRVPQ